ncbi:hypothetical protein M0R72_13475 [Candidatus Pacearchaeota archaeon]|jgi:hypothetical protein|nr:hypothetical protein [Candidatus Pacearchaeota archaeon]
MEWKKPDKLTDADRKQLRDEARATFDGQRILKPRFGFEIAAFRASCARESGDMLHLPIAGGAFEQPEKAMEIITIIQEEYRREKKGAVKK